jgi:TM2 domain-containing membrane protein YozV
LNDLVTYDESGMYREGLGYALWCLIFVGLGGIHRIYLGKYGTGILWLLTGGLFFIGQFIDLFRMRDLVTQANVREGYLPHPRIVRQIAYMTPPPGPAMKPLRHRLLDAAMQHGGAISVTQGVAATGATFEEVEKELSRLLETGYVDVDNAPGTGVVVYKFTELG